MNLKDTSQHSTNLPNPRSKPSSSAPQHKSRNDQASIRASIATKAGALTPQSAFKAARMEQPLSHLQILSEDQRKTLWTDFNSGLSPVDVVIKYGYPALVVQEEYWSYLEFKNIDLTQSQNLLINWLNARKVEIEKILPENLEECNKIINEYDQMKYLTKEQHFKLFDLCLVLAYETGIESVTNPENRTPKGWVRPLCNICSKPLSGLLAKSKEDMAKEALESIKHWRHVRCNEEKKKSEPW